MSDGNLERERLKFEQKKWEESKTIEKERLQLERERMRLSTGAIVIPILVVALTIYGNTQAQKKQSRADFELKAAEVVLEPRTVTESKNRAEGLVLLLPDRFPADFPERLEPMRKKLQSHKSDMDKRALLNLLVAAPKERRKEILELWLAFYPEDNKQIPEAVITLLEDH